MRRQRGIEGGAPPKHDREEIERCTVIVAGRDRRKMKKTMSGQEGDTGRRPANMPRVPFPGRAREAWRDSQNTVLGGAACLKIALGKADKTR